MRNHHESRLRPSSSLRPTTGEQLEQPIESAPPEAKKAKKKTAAKKKKAKAKR